MLKVNIYKLNLCIHSDANGGDFDQLMVSLLPGIVSTNQNAHAYSLNGQVTHNDCFLVSLLATISMHVVGV